MLVAGLLYFLWLEFAPDGREPPFWLGLVLGLAVLGSLRFIRRWQVEVISPRPQTAEHKRAYRRLQTTQVILLAGCFIPMVWMVFSPADSRTHTLAGLVALLGFVVYLAVQPLFVAAYERLFRDIGRTDGAYGF